MPAKRKSGKWANDNRALRKKSKDLIGDAKNLLYRIAHPECEPDPRQRAKLEKEKERQEKLQLALSGDVEALIWCGREFLGQK